TKVRQRERRASLVLLFFLFRPAAARSGFCCFLRHFYSLFLFDHDDKVAHFVNHAADRRRIFALDGVVQAAQTEAANRLADVIGRADEADDLLDLDGALFAGLFFLGAHALLSAAAVAPFCLGDLPRISSTVFERVSATCATSLRLNSAAKVAFTTLCGLEVPSDLVSTL